MKRLVAFLLALVLTISAIPSLFTTPASAASNPSVASQLSSKLPIVTYAMPLSGAARVYSYSDSTLRTRTTGYWIDTFNDPIVITQVSSDGKAVLVKYPSSSASGGYRSRWYAADDILGLASVSVRAYTAPAKYTTYRMSSGSRVTSYGSISKNDVCVMLGSHTIGGNTYYVHVYPISAGTYNKVSGVRYKIALCSYNPNTGGTGDSTTSSFWQWPMAQKNNGYRLSQDFNRYSSSMAAKYGRPYHTGVDMVCSDKKIMAAADGTVVYRGYSNGNGNHIVLKHNFNGQTVYSLYSHLANFNGCPSTGSSVKKGTVIGTMGNTGNSTGAHLHFSIFTGYSTDPVGYAATCGTNRIKHNNIIFFNPVYVVNNNRLP